MGRRITQASRQKREGERRKVKDSEGTTCVISMLPLTFSSIKHFLSSKKSHCGRVKPPFFSPSSATGHAGASQTNHLSYSLQSMSDPNERRPLERIISVVLVQYASHARTLEVWR